MCIHAYRFKDQLAYEMKWLSESNIHTAVSMINEKANGTISLDVLESESFIRQSSIGQIQTKSNLISMFAWLSITRITYYACYSSPRATST